MPPVRKLRLVNPRLKRSEARERLAERIARLRAVNADITQAKEADEKARQEQSALDVEFRELVADAGPSADTRLADFVAGRVDVRGEGASARAYNEKLDQLQAQHKSLAEIRTLAAETLARCEREHLYATRGIDAASRDVIAEIAAGEIDKVTKDVERAQAALSSALRAAGSIYSLSAAGTPVSEKAKRLLTTGLALDTKIEGSAEDARLRKLLAALAKNADATL